MAHSIPGPGQEVVSEHQLTISEIVIPVGDVELDERGRAVARSLADRLDMDVREIHVDIDVDHPAASLNDPATGIVAALAPGSLVVMATAHAGGSPAGHGSVAEEVVRAWPGPVVLVGPGVRVPRWEQSIDFNESIVVPLDGSPMAERAVPVAASLAQVLDVPLWLVQVVDPEVSRKVLELRAAGESVSESAYVRKMAAEASSSRRVGWEIVHGDDPATAVLHFARDQGASMIVTTTRGASGVERMVFGSVSMAMVAAGTHPVVVLGPDASTEPQLT